MNTKVSVIISTYNYGKYLKTAVNSVLNQSFNDFEIIIADDCSTDNTRKVIAEFTDPRIRTIVHEKNIGQAANKNSALKLARGDYIAILDADDWFEKTYLENTIKPFTDSKVGAVYTKKIFHFDNAPSTIPNQKIYNGYIIKELFINNFIGTSVMFRKSAIPKGYSTTLNPEMNNMGCDWWILLELSLDYKIMGIDKPLYNYSHHQGQISSNNLKRIESDKIIQNQFLKMYGNVIPKDVRKKAIYWFFIRKGYYMREENLKFNACISYMNAIKFNPLAVLPLKGILSTILS